MIRLFSTARPPGALDAGLLLLRLGGGGLMLTHGLPKLTQLLAGDFAFADPLGLGEGPSLVLTVLTEVGGAGLLLLGAATRSAAALLLFTMLVAIVVTHATDPLDAKELALLYAVLFGALLAGGGGRYSVDALLEGRRTTSAGQ